jgi:hypothetical protein
MRRDMAQRVTLARVDDTGRRNRVAAARETVYEKNYAVNSAAVENLLQEDSLVPTAVCLSYPAVFVSVNELLLF